MNRWRLVRSLVGSLVVVLLVAASCEQPRVLSVSIDAGDITLAVDETRVLTAAASARGGASTAVAWSSASPGIATVTSAGAVRGVAPGSTQIVATSVFDPSKRDSIVATVVAGPWTLAVARAGSGSGTVTSVPAGIDCGSACSAAFVHGTSVALTAAPAAGSSFVGWGGACGGAAATCVVSMTEARSVTATFTLLTVPRTLSVTREGSGTVSSAPPGIDCGSACSAQFEDGTDVALAATEAAGWTFSGWGGACSGTTPACALSMTENLSVTATFEQVMHTLSVARAGSGSGTVTSAPAGISCGALCSAQFAHGTIVTLTTAPAAGSVFEGWSGACTGTGSCTVNMTQARAATATFVALPGTFTISGNVSPSDAWASGGPDAALGPAGGAWFASDKPVAGAVGAPATGVVRDLRGGPDWEAGDWATATPGVHYMPNEILVGFRDHPFSMSALDAATLSPNQVAALDAELHAAAGALADDHGFSVRSTTPLLRVARMRFADDLTLVEAMARLATDPRVAYVEPNGIYRAHAAEPAAFGPAPGRVDAAPAATHPWDALYPDQAWHYGFVGAQRGWDTQRGSPAVRVAVVDTGYRPDHPDAPFFIADEYDFVGFDAAIGWHWYAYCSDGSITRPRAWDLTGYDDNATEWMSYRYDAASNCLIEPNAHGSHGMHVIGTIAADWWNVGGVGLNYDVTIIPVQALDLAGNGTWDDLANAILYAGGLASAAGVPTITRADVINLSLGGQSTSSTLANAVTAASNAGSLIIASAGNAGTSAQQYPAAYPEVVAVTAIGADGTRASYSSFGSWVELTAPGGDFATAPYWGVWSTTFDYSRCSTTPREWCHHGGDGEATWTAFFGTSMAAPHVSGIAALYKATNPALTRVQLRQTLRDLAFDWGPAGFDDDFGYGLAHVRPGLGVPVVNSDGVRRVQLVDAGTGATVDEVTTNVGGDYAFTGVPDGSYYVLAASSNWPTYSYGATGAAISAYAVGDPGWFQGATPVTVAGADLTGIDIRLGWPAWQLVNGTPATAAFMHPGYYAVITYDHAIPDRWFRIRVATAGRYRIWTDGFNSPDRCGFGVIGAAANGFDDLDTVIELYASDGTTLIAANDDALGRGWCSELDLNLAAGTYLVMVRAFAGPSSAHDGRGTILRFDPR